MRYRVVKPDQSILLIKLFSFKIECRLNAAFTGFDNTNIIQITISEGQPFETLV